MDDSDRTTVVRTSAIVMLLGLLAVIVVFAGSLAIPKDVLTRLTVSLVILTSVVAAGIVTCFLSGYHIYKHGRQVNVSSWSQRINSNNLQLIFLWLFAILSTFYCSSKAVVQIQCLDAMSVPQILYNVALILFMLSETTLISFLSSYRLSKWSFKKYTVPLLIAVNLSMWFDALVKEHTKMTSDSPSNHTHNISDWIRCAKNSTAGIFYHRSWRFVSPAFVEFSLLAITLLTELPLAEHADSPVSSSGKPSSKDSDQTNNRAINKDDDEDLEYLNDDQDVENKMDENEKDDESTPLLNHRDEVNSLLTSDSVIGVEGYVNTTYHRNKEPIPTISTRTHISTYLSMLLSVLICLPSLLAYAIQVTQLPTNIHITLFLNWYEVSVKTIMVLAVLMNFHVIENMTSPPSSKAAPFTARDLVFMGSVFSMFCTHCFEMLAGCISDNPASQAILVANCTSIVQDYVQTVFLLHVSRCQRKTSNDSRALFVSLCIFLTVTNFGCWLIDSLIVSHSIKQTRKAQVDVLAPTIWRTTKNIFEPLTIYYRFASAFAFHALCKRYT